MSLPLEVSYEILYYLPLPDVLRECRVSRESRNICNDDFFWMKYSQFNKLGLKEPDETWKEHVLRSYPKTTHTFEIELTRPLNRRELDEIRSCIRDYIPSHNSIYSKRGLQINRIYDVINTDNILNFTVEMKEPEARYDVVNVYSDITSLCIPYNLLPEYYE